MGFKENLLKKIDIDQLAGRVIRSLNQPDSGSRFDKAAMQKLLAMGEYSVRRERDMDLYILENNLENDADKKKILVLDNGLGIYNTSIKDVCLRKSPTVKEMISIRNAIKILSDKDVVLSKKADSVQTVQTDIVDGLDLAYTMEDLDQIQKEGQASFENQYADGVLEALGLFAELLEYRDAPKAFQVPHHLVLGGLQTDTTGKTVVGPMVIYDKVRNTLKWIDTPIDPSDKEKMDLFHQIVDGHADAAKKGKSVFGALKSLVKPYQH